MAKSIIQKDWDRCFLCHDEKSLEEHHVFGGNPGRKLSETYGLKVRLCHKCHNEPPEGVHFDEKLMESMHKVGQLAFEKKYTRDEFIKLFQRNYL